MNIRSVVVISLALVVACQPRENRSINGRAYYEIKTDAGKCMVYAGADLNDSSAAGDLSFFTDKDVVTVIDTALEIDPESRSLLYAFAPEIKTVEPEYFARTTVVFPVGRCLSPTTVLVIGSIRDTRGRSSSFRDTLRIGEFMFPAKSLNPRLRELAARWAGS